MRKNEYEGTVTESAEKIRALLFVFSDLFYGCTSLQEMRSSQSDWR